MSLIGSETCTMPHMILALQQKVTSLTHLLPNILDNTTSITLLEHYDERELIIVFLSSDISHKHVLLT